MKKLVTLPAAAFALLSVSSAAMAATQLGEHLTFSGFGTLGAVVTDSDEGKFGRDRQTGGADTSASLDVDTNLGLQLTGTATPWLSATVQVLAAKRDRDRIEPQFEWAFVTVKPVDGLSLRGGRMSAPVFAVSDSLSVGYANNWVRAPNEVYAMNVFRRFDGLDATYRHSLGSVALSATAFGGKTRFRTGGANAEGKSLKGINLQVETDWATFRAGQVEASVFAPDLGVKNDPYKFSGIGVTVDRDNIMAQAEFVRRSSGTSGDIVNASGWYVMGGYRFGNVMPYAILSHTKPKNPDSFILLSAEQSTQALGVRWDAFRSAALKFQLDRIDTHGTQGISFTTPATPPAFPGLPPGVSPVTKPVTVLSIALDYTF